MGIIVKKLIQTVQGKKTFLEFFLCFPHCQRTDHTVDRGNIRQGKFTGIRYIVIPGILYFLVPQILRGNLIRYQRRHFQGRTTSLCFSIYAVQYGQHCVRAVSVSVLYTLFLRYSEFYDISQKHFLVPEQRFLSLHPVSFSQSVAPGQKEKLNQMGIPDMLLIKADPKLFEGITVRQGKRGIMAGHDQMIPQKHLIAVCRLIFQVRIFIQQCVQAADDFLQPARIRTEISPEIFPSLRRLRAHRRNILPVQAIPFRFQYLVGGRFASDLLQKNLFLIRASFQLSGLFCQSLQQFFGSSPDPCLSHQSKAALPDSRQGRSQQPLH